jgi:RimJ/RimL family protein N-acetyltransferase
MAAEEQWIRDVVLEGTRARIEPLAPHHATDLFEAGSDEDTWRWLARGPLTSPGDAADFIAGALRLRERGDEFPFAIIDRATGRACGSTRFLAIRPEARGLEIGWTWLGAPWRRTGMNRECKLLLLTHAFESLGCMRVEFKTDALNARSRAAMEAIGCVYEGTFRQHRFRRDGSRRDSVYYSIIDSEWPSVKARLAGGELLR